MWNFTKKSNNKLEKSGSFFMGRIGMWHLRSKQRVRYHSLLVIGIKIPFGLPIGIHNLNSNYRDTITIGVVKTVGLFLFFFLSRSSI